MSPLTRTMFIAIGFLVLTSCAKPKEEKETRVGFESPIADTVPAIYRPLFDMSSQEDANSIRSRLPFESITIERGQCFGMCPVYKMVLYRDGRADLDAEKYMPDLGQFTGEVPLYTYGRLCYFIESSHFMEMNSKYSANATDLRTCTVTVWGKGVLKDVSDYGTVGPIQLWAIQQLLDAVRDEIEWKPVE